MRLLPRAIGGVRMRVFDRVPVCGRCGIESRDTIYRLVDLEAEAKQDGRVHVGPIYGREDRCKDRKACAERARGAA